MNKYQEALNCFTECWGCTKPEYYNDVMNKLRIEKERKKLLQNLVDKATPKEIHYMSADYGTCPSCNGEVMNGDNYCIECGQRLE